MVGLAFVLALLVVATVAALVGLGRELRRERENERTRAAFRARIRAELERERLVHDRVYQLPLAEEATDYLTIMAQRDAYQSQASAQTGNRSYVTGP